MILSEHKGGLSVAAAVTGLGALMALALWIRLLFGGPVSDRLEQAAFTLCMLAVLSGLVAILLLSEHAGARRARGVTSARALEQDQIAAVIRHCPAPVKIACLVGAALATLQGLAIGDADWLPGHTPSIRELRGFLSAALFFSCLSLPVIASAASMEGGYSE
jgi:hypothetical protein